MRKSSPFFRLIIIILLFVSTLIFLSLIHYYFVINLYTFTGLVMEIVQLVILVTVYKSSSIYPLSIQATEKKNSESTDIFHSNTFIFL